MQPHRLIPSGSAVRCFIVFSSEDLVPYQAFSRTNITGWRTLAGLCNAAVSKKPNWFEERSSAYMLRPFTLLETILHAIFRIPTVVSLHFLLRTSIQLSYILTFKAGIASNDSSEPVQRVSSTRSANPASAQIAKHCSTSQNPRRNSHPLKVSAPHLLF